MNFEFTIYYIIHCSSTQKWHHCKKYEILDLPPPYVAINHIFHYTPPIHKLPVK